VVGRGESSAGLAIRRALCPTWRGAACCEPSAEFDRADADDAVAGRWPYRGDGEGIPVPTGCSVRVPPFLWFLPLGGMRCAGAGAMWWFGYHLLSTPRRVERPAAVSGLTRRQPWADLWLLLVFVLCCCHVRDRWKRSHRRLVVDCSSRTKNVKDLPPQDRRA